MTSDERQRAAYNDLLRAAAAVDSHGWLDEDPETVTHFRAARRHLAATVDLLCVRIGAYRPTQCRLQWRHPLDRLP